MPQAVIGAVAAPVAGAIAGRVLGGGSPKATAAVPGDLQGMRGQQINLLNALLGFGGQPGAGQATQGPLTLANARQRAEAARAGGQMGPMGAGGNPADRLEQFFGPLGMPTSALQQQSLGGISQYLASNPLQQANSALNQILGMAPGAGMMDALQPRFQQNLATANQAGGRFSSGNALMRARALDDYNLLAAQAAQTGIGQQLQAAQMQGMLGQAQMGMLGQAYGIGSAQANQENMRQQQALQILQQLLGTAQSATLGAPVQVSPSGTQQGLQAGLGLAGILAGMGGQGGGIPAAPNVNPYTMQPGFYMPHNLPR